MRQLLLFAGGACLLVSAVLAVAADEQPRQPQPRRFDPARLLEQYDKNKDGFLDRSEVPERMRQRFDQMDLNKDGKLSKEELEKAAAGPARQQPGQPGQRSEINTPPARGERLTTNLKVGDAAPDFTLPLVAGKSEVTLSSFKGKQPVVLIFASYT